MCKLGRLQHFCYLCRFIYHLITVTATCVLADLLVHTCSSYNVHVDVCYGFVQVGYAMTTFNQETKQPVIGFDMGGKTSFCSSHTPVGFLKNDVPLLWSRSPSLNYSKKKCSRTSKFCWLSRCTVCVVILPILMKVLQRRSTLVVICLCGGTANDLLGYQVRGTWNVVWERCVGA